MYGLSEEDLRIQAGARGFADELIPFEEEAERSGGELPPDITVAHEKRARELGLQATNMPKELGGGGCTSLQQVLVQEQMGRVTNALGWVATTPPSWLPAVATPGQIERYVRPAIAGERTCAPRPRTWSAPRATGWPSRTSGSGSSGWPLPARLAPRRPA
jgi:acyl-CoA dehydrogenase